MTNKHTQLVALLQEALRQQRDLTDAAKAVIQAHNDRDLGITSDEDVADAICQLEACLN